MTGKAFLAAVTAGFLLPTLALPGDAPAVQERARTDKDLHAIEAAIQRSDAGWNSGDAEAATADYGEDAELIPPNGRELHGHQAIFAAQREMLANSGPNTPPGSPQPPPNDSIRFVSQGVAVVMRTFVAGTRSGHSLRVFVKRRNQWQIVAEEIMIDFVEKP